jgi:gliding motility-associated-like protein
MLKNRFYYFLIVITVAFANIAIGQGIGDWTWIKNSGSSGAGFFGVQGIASALNEPPSRYAPFYWTDLSNNLWLYGGNGRNDLWKYNIVTNQWTFINGSSTSGLVASMGIKGLPSPLNQPGATTLTHPSWVDNNGDLWLYYRVLWKYNIASNQWTWVSGNNGPATFGTPGIASALNSPSSNAFNECRGAWVDAVTNDFWLYDALSSDMWKYTTSTNLWTFIKGSMGGSSTGNLGMLNVPSSTNLPKSSFCYSNWKDTNGDFYIYIPLSNNVYNVVWKYNKTTNMWVWIDGQLSNSAISSGYCNSAFPNFPAGSLEYRTLPNSACPNTYWVYGGQTNKLWLYNVVSKNWTWVKGPGIANNGTMGIPNNANFPLSNFGSSLWNDPNNNLWMLGNVDNRLWKYQPDSTCLAAACSLPDSIVYLNGCSGDSFLLGNGTYAIYSGTYVVNILIGTTFKSIYYYITLSPPIVFTILHQLCGSQGVWLANGTFVTNSGTYYDTLSNQLGCDSINKHIIYKTTTVTVFFHSICDNQPIVLPSGISTFTPGTYIDTLTNINGCDSIVKNIISAQLGITTYDTITDTICNNTTYTLLGGQVVSLPGTYSDTTQNASGCPKINTYYIYTTPFLQTNTIYLCNGSSYTLPDNTVVNTAGAYFTYSYLGQCFITSVTFINTINSFNVAVYDTICANQFYTTPLGHVVNLSGIYQDTFQTIYGCDSIISTHLKVMPTYNYSQTIQTCVGQLVQLPSGVFSNLPGQYHDTLTAMGGCDSIIHTQLIFDSIHIINVFDTICNGHTYTLPNGAIVTLQGLYIDTLQGAISAICDTLIKTNLVVLPTSTKLLSINICANQFYTLPNGQVVNTATIYNHTLINAAGCDSIVTYNVTIKPTSNRTINAAICNGHAYTLPSGNSVTNAGNYIDTFVNYLGCDSFVTTTLTVHPTHNTNVNDTFCKSQTYIIPNGLLVQQPGLYSYKLKNRFSCDSIIHLDLKQIEQPTFRLASDTSFCFGTQITLVPQNVTSTNVNYWWSNLSNTPEITINQSGIYTLSITEPPCAPISQKITVQALDCDCKLTLPNAFTPNGDELNSKFMPINICDLIPTEYQFIIYSRWGEVLFNTKIWNEGWNGYFKGNQMEVGTYIYYIEYKNPTLGYRESQKGDFTLIK